MITWTKYMYLVFEHDEMRREMNERVDREKTVARQITTENRERTGIQLYCDPCTRAANELNNKKNNQTNKHHQR